MWDYEGDRTIHPFGDIRPIRIQPIFAFFSTSARADTESIWRKKRKAMVEF
jgi:hypothetical protein